MNFFTPQDLKRAIIFLKRATFGPRAMGWCPFIIVKNTFDSHNYEFAGNRVGRHINIKHQNQTAFINLQNLCDQKFVSGITIS